MKSKICILAVVLFSCLTANATDVPVANFIVTVFKNCNTGDFSALSTDPTVPSDYQAEIVSVRPLQCDINAFLGKDRHFTYQIANDGTVTFTKKKKFFLGSDTSIVLGSVDIATMCDSGTIPQSGLISRKLVVSLLPSVTVSQDIEMGDTCTQSAQIMGSQPFTFNRPYTNTVTISD